MPLVSIPLQIWKGTSRLVNLFMKCVVLICYKAMFGEDVKLLYVTIDVITTVIMNHHRTTEHNLSKCITILLLLLG